MILLTKSNVETLLDKYEKELKLEPGTLLNLDLAYCRVWNGVGTVNCHTYPVIKNETNIVDLVENVYKILELCKGDIKPCGKYEFSWEFKEINKEEKLVEIKDDCIKLNTLIAFALLMYGKDKAIYEVAKVLNKQEI